MSGIPIGQLAELRNALDFLDRVRKATLDEQIAVGTDHWERLEAAARRIVEHYYPETKS